MRNAAIPWALVLLLGPTALAEEKAPRTMPLDLGGGVTLETVLIPAGEFTMGSPENVKERQESEAPHAVRITKPFYMGKYEVTNGQYRRFRPGHHSRYLDDDTPPVLWVSWYDADAFCRWLSARARKNVRLPTEAEWEYACRAGTTTRFYTGNNIRGHMNSPDLPKAAWYGGNSRGRSKPVGGLAPNAFGLYDMHGNAWEWCSDWYGHDYYKKSPVADPKGPATGAAKVLRGGCYLYWATYYCRSAHRYSSRPDAREPVTGFRVVVEPGPLRERPAPKITQPWPPPRTIAPLIWRGLPMTGTTDKELEVARRFGGPTVVVPEVPAPTIDGTLNDAAWKMARPLAFRWLNGRAATPTQPTEARVVCDKNGLYFAFRCSDDEMHRLTVAGKKRDDPIWQGDTVEIFLDPHHKQKPGGYFHIAVNPAGLTMDTGEGRPGWDPKLNAATARSRNGWTAEVALPFSELALAKDQIPTVWGMNLTRFRPDFATGKPRLGTLVPHSWPVDRPDLLRSHEDTGWAPTLCDSSHVPFRFGHAVIKVGTRETKPPAKLFELIAREDFSSGTRGKFTKGTVEDGGYMGLGKRLRFNAKDGATVFQCPLEKFRDVQLLCILKRVAGSGIYWHTFTRNYGSNKACARQVTTLTRDPVRLAPTFNYCDGAGRIDFTSSGVADPYFAGYKKHLSWFSEPTIGRIQAAGPDHWAIAYTRVGDLQTQHPHNRRVDPDKDWIRGWFFHPSGAGDMLISDAVMFRGTDNQPPDEVTGVKCDVRGDKVRLSWKPAKDNTLTIWYKVIAADPGLSQPRIASVAEVPALSVTLPFEKIRGKAISICAVDFFENVSTPSKAIEVK